MAIYRRQTGAQQAGDKAVGLGQSAWGSPVLALVAQAAEVGAIIV